MQHNRRLGPAGSRGNAVSVRYDRFQIVVGENTIVVARIATGKVEGFAFPMVAKKSSGSAGASSAAKSGMRWGVATFSAACKVGMVILLGCRIGSPAPSRPPRPAADLGERGLGVSSLV